MNERELDRYHLKRHEIPSGDLKYISEYEMLGPDLQNLQQQDLQVCGVVTLDLSVATTPNAPFLVNIPGRACYLLGALTANLYNPDTNLGLDVYEPSAFVNCRVNSNQAQNAIPLKHNRGFIGSFLRLYLSWPAQEGVSAKIVVLKSERLPWNINETDARFSLVEATQLVTGSVISLTGGAAAVVIAPALSTRKCTAIQNQGSTPIWVGGSTVTVGSGVKLNQDDIYLHRNTSALYGVATTSNTAVSINTET